MAEFHVKENNLKNRFCTSADSTSPLSVLGSLPSFKQMAEHRFLLQIYMEFVNSDMLFTFLIFFILCIIALIVIQPNSAQENQIVNFI